jgi:hypothetical protein
LVDVSPRDISIDKTELTFQLTGSTGPVSETDADEIKDVVIQPTTVSPMYILLVSTKATRPEYARQKRITSHHMENGRASDFTHTYFGFSPILYYKSFG